MLTNNCNRYWSAIPTTFSPTGNAVGLEGRPGVYDDMRGAMLGKGDAGAVWDSAWVGKEL
jgi:hypothetical protein